MKKLKLASLIFHLSAAILFAQESQPYRWVVKVTPSLVYLDGGSSAGIAVDDRFVIFRPTQEDDENKKVAEVLVLRVFEKMAIAEIVSADLEIQVLDNAVMEAEWKSPDDRFAGNTGGDWGSVGSEETEETDGEMDWMSGTGDESIAQPQGKYVRKSVSSVESVWVKPGVMPAGLDFGDGFFERMLEFYIEVPRFDFNELPETLIQDFRYQANSLEEVSPKAISEVMEATVADEIQSILNDPDVLQQRMRMLRDEADWEGFAAAEAKSLGLTENELRILMNSAYIYLPYVYTVELKQEGGKVDLKLEGGIVWYQVKIAPTGEIAIEEVKAIKSEGRGFAKEGEDIFETFLFGSEKYHTTPRQYAFYAATQALIKNLSVKTKEIEDFKLSAQVVERSGNQVAFPLGLREGVHLDDGFFVSEYIETDSGQIKAERKGYVRIASTGNNKKDLHANSYGVRWKGSAPGVGDIVVENPRLGLDMRLRSGIISGMVIKPSYVVNPFTGNNLLKDEVNQSLLTELAFAYNMGPIIGISQTFLDIDIGFGILLAEFADEVDALPYTVSIYGGLTKKIWIGGANLGVSFGGGFDSLNMTGIISTGLFGEDKEDFTYSVLAPGIKAGGDLEFLLTPNLAFNLNAGYKFGLRPFTLALKVGEEKASYTGLEVAELYPDLQLGGTYVTAGFNYALGELPINILGFLDPLKRY